jgi:hypothetical protein
LTAVSQARDDPASPKKQCSILYQDISYVLSVGLGTPEDVSVGGFSTVVELAAGGRSGFVASATGGRSTVVELPADEGSTVVEFVAGGRSIDVEFEGVVGGGRVQLVEGGVIIVLLLVFGSGNVVVPFLCP